jgi:hypothetical protein
LMAKWWASPCFALHLSHLFCSWWICTYPFKHPCMAHSFFPKHLSIHYEGSHNIFSKICSKCHAHLSDPLWYRIRSVTRLQIEGCKI